jgi:uncharacterized membrane protein required for colicin V production
MGLTWLDATMLVVILAFAVRGLLTGFMSQIFGVLGVIAGLFAASWSGQWVASHWDGAQPTVVFWLLRWLVVVLVGLAVAGLFQWWGSLLGKAFEASPLGFIHRPGGFVLGAGLGAFVSAFLLLGLLFLPWSGGIAGAAARSRTPRPVFAGITAVLHLTEGLAPGSHWLRGRFEAAQRRIERAVPASHAAN